ncbi:bifunctional non-homologous end joining protein LigD [Halopseudomonas sabulinigri]|uniref:DNA ligase (ATP) n=1 Tax=Halopseudomonas sabulinigri TaxID=472181 RepID=A0A1H1PEP9_9GAMM|nr:DNA ligase D [Halopseudomonas sabulinigri]SDS09109.1 bifunctional non-homologous end joining protein LigD [Halopseudomonas sabulinigri]
MASSHSEYNSKRDFKITKEPRQTRVRKRSGKHNALQFVVQKHEASHLHYDFRLELDGALKSWAVPKGPSLDPSEKRLAVHVEDHPLSYAGFEGSIPKGQYGGGDVIVWDHGTWQPVGDPQEAYRKGKLKFVLQGDKLAGRWNLVRTRMGGSKEQWLLIKEADDAAREHAEFDVLNERPESVITGELLPLDQQAGKKKAAGKSKAGAASKAGKAKAEKPEASVKAARKSTAKKRSRARPDMPAMLKPQLATLADAPPSGDWQYEIKFDGYRLLARVQGAEVRLFTRNGNDWTDRLGTQAAAIADLQLKDSWLDGEVVVLNDNGLPDFQALQNAFDQERDQSIVFYLFDAPFLNGTDLRDEPLEARREALRSVLDQNENDLLRYSSEFAAHHDDLYASACRMALEGLIGKRRGSTYVSKRSADWIKLKCRLRQEFVIVGYTDPKGSRIGFGALLLGVHTALGSGELRYAGRVGTGFDNDMLDALHKRMKKLVRKTTPLVNTQGVPQAGAVNWIKPELICEVEFAEWTQQQRVRQAAFMGLRSDKPAKDILQEQPTAAALLQTPQAVSAGAQKSTKVEPDMAAPDHVAGVRISHADRVIDTRSGHRKGELAAFYASIGEWVLPHLKGRPVSLLRAPEGVEGEQFFQRHASQLQIPHLTELDQALDPDHAPLMEINSIEALVGTVQMGAIELHTWGATHDRIERPDHLVLDLDPDPKLPWSSMLEATRLTLSVLDELGLEAWLKTSGGKGIHIIIPVARHLDWEAAKNFTKAISRFMAEQLPERFVDKMGPRNRVGKIFVDYLRNQRGSSTVAAYSVRARPGLAVSVPIARSELDHLRSAAQWHIGNLSERLQQLEADPWADYHNRQRVTKSMWERLNEDAP